MNRLLLIYLLMRQPKDIRVVSVIDSVDEDDLIEPIEERLCVEALATVIINFYREGINDYNKMVSALIGSGSYSYTPKTLDLNSKNI